MKREMGMKYTDVAWDFDGTLVDTYPNCTRAFREALESYGYTADEAEIRLKMSITIRHAEEFYAEKFGLDRSELHVRYKQLEGFRPEAMVLYPGIVETLKAIKDSGRRNHLYTNRNRDAVRYLEAFGIRQYFDGMYTQENIGRLKPEPDGLHKLCQEYQIKPEQLLMVGDRWVDIQAAKAARADGCFYNTNDIPVPDGVDILVGDIRELIMLLANVNLISS